MKTMESAISQSGIPSMMAHSERPCPRCGQLLEYPEYSGLLEFLNGIAGLCDACAAIREREAGREALRDRCKARYSDLLHRGLVSAHFREASFSKSRADIEALNPEAWTAGRDWDRQQNLYIHGHIGTGKTYLALCVLRKSFVAGLSVAETTARQFVKISDLFRDPTGLMDGWKSVDVLLLDDFDKATWSLERIDGLWELLNARMAAGRRTVLTGNATLRDIAITMRERTGDAQQGTRNTARADAALERLKPITQLVLHGKSLRNTETQ